MDLLYKCLTSQQQLLPRIRKKTIKKDANITYKGLHTSRPVHDLIEFTSEATWYSILKSNPNHTFAILKINSLIQDTSTKGI